LDNDNTVSWVVMGNGGQCIISYQIRSSH